MIGDNWLPIHDAWSLPLYRMVKKLDRVFRISSSCYWHLISRLGLGSVLQQQPYHPLVAVLGSQDEASLPVLRFGKAHWPLAADGPVNFGAQFTPLPSLSYAQWSSDLIPSPSLSLSLSCALFSPTLPPELGASNPSSLFLLHSLYYLLRPDWPVVGSGLIMDSFTQTPFHFDSSD